MWHELGTALCLLLVIEGVFPFLYSGRWRNMVVKFSEIEDRTMRIAGLASMLLGTGLLYLIN